MEFRRVLFRSLRDRLRRPLGLGRPAREELAGPAQRGPRLVVLGVADPDLEILVDPRPAVQVGERLDERRAPDRAADGRGLRPPARRPAAADPRAGTPPAR